MEQAVLPRFFKSLLFINDTGEDVKLYLLYDRYNRIPLEKNTLTFICFCNVDLLRVTTYRKGHTSQGYFKLFSTFTISQKQREFEIELIHNYHGHLTFIVKNKCRPMTLESATAYAIATFFSYRKFITFYQHIKDFLVPYHLKYNPQNNKDQP